MTDGKSGIAMQSRYSLFGGKGRILWDLENYLASTSIMAFSVSGQRRAEKRGVPNKGPGQI